MPRLLFLVLVIIEFLHLNYLISGHRMPLGHDGFFYFSMQYFFLNDVAINREIPLWIPYVNHGITATWFYIIQGCFGPLADALLLAGRAIASFNFLSIFHLGIFVDRLLLLTGVWLLGHRYFKSALTRFFVASCVMGGTVTMTQFYFTLHLYYAIPLLLYFGHVFLDTGKWRYFFLACNLFMLQMIGNAAYFLPIITLTVFLYFLFYALDGLSRFREQINNLRWGVSSVAGIAGGLFSLSLLGAVLLAAKDPAWINLDFGRTLDNSASLNVFLTYAGNMDFKKWQELLLRLSPSLDFSVYMGFFAVPLVLFGVLFSRDKSVKPLLLVSLVLLFFSMGTWISVFFYYTWPMMKFYRHLALVVPVIKLLLLFLAGFGFEKLFVYRETWQGQRMVSYSCLFTGVLLLLLSMALSQVGHHGLEASHYIVKNLTVQTSQTPSTFDPLVVGHRLKQASVFAMLTGIVFLVLPLILAKNIWPAVAFAVLFINTADIYGYYFTEINERTFVLNQDQYKITAFSPMPYASRRVVSAPNPRASILLSPIGQHTLLSTTNAFLFQDALATRYRTIQRLKPLHDLLSALGPKALENKGFLKIAGSSVDKIQFFKQACSIHDDKQLASFLGDPKYKGDVLFVSGEQSNFIPECLPQENISANDRLDVPYKIGRFTPNTLEVTVNSPFVNPVWMMYADVWHQNWKAQVNGKTAPVLKADMAYKAVLLDPGKNIVNFTFADTHVVFLEKVVAVNACVWLFFLVYLMVGIFRAVI